MWKPPVFADIENSASNWRLDPKLSGGGYFHDLAPHQLDLMIWYFGLPLHYHGFSFNQMKRYPADDMVGGTIIFNDNIVFTGSWNFAVSEQDGLDECTIVGSKGSIRFPTFGNKVLLKARDGKEEFTFEHPKHIQQPMIDAVVKYFRGKSESLCPMKEACAVMEIMDSFGQHPEI